MLKLISVKFICLTLVQIGKVDTMQQAELHILFMSSVRKMQFPCGAVDEALSVSFSDAAVQI